MYQRKKSLKGNPQRCVHYWIVEPANDVTSEAHCCKCLSVKKFNNILMDVDMPRDERDTRNRSSWLFAG